MHPHERHLANLLLASAARTPNNVAVRDAVGRSLTYSRLNSLTDSLSARMRELGVRPGDRIGLSLPKSIGSIASLFAALKCGGAYVPVDADAPPQRNCYIFSDCTVRAFITDAAHVESLVAELPEGATFAIEDIDSLLGFGQGLRLVTVDWGRAAVESPEGLAYILYTSGSTGKPKGVMHTHASALCFVDWSSEAVKPSGRDRFSSHAPLHFDLSVFDIFVAIRHGATIVLIGEELGKQPLRLAPFIVERGITVWYSTPSILRLLIEFGKLEIQPVPELRVLIFAGEVFPLKYLRQLQDIWPQPAYFNFYGPTETNVCTYFPVPCPLGEVTYETLPIGFTCSDDRARVVDIEGIDVADAEDGELIVSGGSVMHGYWNLPERNASAFQVEQDGTRWYRTGDIVRFHPHLGYEFIGRRDRMIKRRGYRVELGEIEAALYKHPEIAEAAAVALTSPDNDVSIRAVIVWTGERKASLIALKKYCAANLPSYMIPDTFRFLDRLPKTSTDKVDYQAIKEL